MNGPLLNDPLLNDPLAMKSSASTPPTGNRNKPTAPQDAQPVRASHSGSGAASVLPRLKEWERSRAKGRANRDTDRGGS